MAELLYMMNYFQDRLQHDVTMRALQHHILHNADTELNWLKIAAWWRCCIAVGAYGRYSSPGLAIGCRVYFAGVFLQRKQLSTKHNVRQRVDPVSWLRTNSVVISVVVIIIITDKLRSR